jgi:hypothetical protein
MTRNLALTLTCALILGVAAPFASAQSTSDPNEPRALNNSSGTPKVSEQSEKVRADMAKLVADAKAGKVVPRTSQFPQHQRNNLSKGAKIAIVAGIVVVVLAIIVVHEVNNIHCESRCVQ